MATRNEQLDRLRTIACSIASEIQNVDRDDDLAVGEAYCGVAEQATELATHANACLGADEAAMAAVDADLASRMK